MVVTIIQVLTMPNLNMTICFNYPLPTEFKDRQGSLPN